MEAIFNELFLEDLKRVDNSITIMAYSLDTVPSRDNVIQTIAKRNLSELESVWDDCRKDLCLFMNLSDVDILNSNYNAVVVYYSLFEKVNNIAFILIESDLSKIEFCQTRNTFTIEFPLDTVAEILTNKSDLSEYLEGPGNEVGVNLFNSDNNLSSVVARDSYYRYIRLRNSSQLFNNVVWLDELGRTQSDNYTFKVYDESTFNLSVFDSTNFIALNDGIRTKFNLPIEGSTVKLVGSVNYTLYKKVKGQIIEVGTGLDEITGLDGVEIVWDREYSLNGFNCEVDNLNHNVTCFKPFKNFGSHFPPSGVFHAELSFLNPVTENDSNIKTIKSNNIRLVQGEDFGIFRVINRSTSYFKSYNDKGAIYIFDYHAGSLHSFTIEVKSELFDRNKSINLEFENEEVLTDIFDISYDVEVLDNEPNLYHINVTLTTKSDNNEKYWLPAIKLNEDDEEPTSTLLYSKFKVKLGKEVYTETFYMAQHAFVVGMNLHEYLGNNRFNQTDELVYDSVNKLETRKLVSLANESVEDDQYYWKVIAIDDNITIRDVDTKSKLTVGKVVASERDLVDGFKYIIDNDFETEDMEDKRLDDLVFVKINKDDVDKVFEDNWESALKYYYLRIGIIKKGQPARLDIQSPDNSSDYQRDDVFKTASIFPTKIESLYLNIKSNCLFTATIEPILSNVLPDDSITFFKTDSLVFTPDEDDLESLKSGNYKLYFRVDSWGLHKSWSNLFNVKFTYNGEKIRPYKFDIDNAKYYEATIIYKLDVQEEPELKLLSTNHVDNNIVAGVPRINVEGLTAIDFFLPNIVDSDTGKSGDVIFTSKTTPIFNLNSAVSKIDKKSIDVVYTQVGDDAPKYLYHRLNLINSADPKPEYELPDYPATSDNQGIITVYKNGVRLLGDKDPKITIGLFTQHKPVNLEVVVSNYIKSLESQGAFYNETNSTLYLPFKLTEKVQQDLCIIGSYYRNPLSLEIIPNVCRSSKTYSRSLTVNPSSVGKFEREDTAKLTIGNAGLSNDGNNTYFKVSGLYGKDVYLNTDPDKLDTGNFTDSINLTSNGIIYDTVNNPKETADINTTLEKEAELYQEDVDNDGAMFKIKKKDSTDLHLYRLNLDEESVYMTRTSNEYDTTGTLTVGSDPVEVETEIDCDAYPLYTKELDGTVYYRSNKEIFKDVSEIFIGGPRAATDLKNVAPIVETPFGNSLPGYNPDSENIYLLADKSDKTVTVYNYDEVQATKVPAYSKIHLSNIFNEKYDGKTCDKVVESPVNGLYYAFPSSLSSIDVNKLGEAIGDCESSLNTTPDYNKLFDSYNTYFSFVDLEGDDAIYDLERDGSSTVTVITHVNSVDTVSGVGVYYFGDGGFNDYIIMSKPLSITSSDFKFFRTSKPKSESLSSELTINEAIPTYSFNSSDLVRDSNGTMLRKLPGEDYHAIDSNGKLYKNDRPTTSGSTWNYVCDRFEVPNVTVKAVSSSTTKTFTQPVYKVAKYAPIGSIVSTKNSQQILRQYYVPTTSEGNYVVDVDSATVWGNVAGSGTIKTDSLPNTYSYSVAGGTMGGGTVYFNPDLEKESYLLPTYFKSEELLNNVYSLNPTGNYTFEYKHNNYITSDLSKVPAKSLTSPQSVSELGSGVYKISDYIFTKDSSNKEIKKVTDTVVRPGSSDLAVEDAYPLYKKTVQTGIHGVLTSDGWKVVDDNDHTKAIDITTSKTSRGDKEIVGGDLASYNNLVIGNEPDGGKFSVYGSEEVTVQKYDCWKMTDDVSMSYPNGSEYSIVFEHDGQWYGTNESLLENQQGNLEISDASEISSPTALESYSGFANVLIATSGRYYTLGRSSTLYLWFEKQSLVNKSDTYGLFLLKDNSTGKYVTQNEGAPTPTYAFIMPKSVSTRDSGILVKPVSSEIRIKNLIRFSDKDEFYAERPHLLPVDIFVFKNKLSIPGGAIEQLEFSVSSKNDFTMEGSTFTLLKSDGSTIEVTAEALPSSYYKNDLDSSNCIVEEAKVAESKITQSYYVRLYDKYTSHCVIGAPDGTYRYHSGYDVPTSGAIGQTLDDLIGTTEVTLSAPNSNNASGAGWFGYIVLDKSEDVDITLTDYFVEYDTYPIYYKPKSDSYIFEHLGKEYTTNELEKSFTLEQLETMSTYTSKTSDDGTKEVSIGGETFTWKSPDSDGGVVYIGSGTTEVPTYGYTLYSPTKGFFTVYSEIDVEFDKVLSSGQLYSKKDSSETDVISVAGNVEKLNADFGNWWVYKCGDVVKPGNVDIKFGWLIHSSYLYLYNPSINTVNKLTERNILENVINTYEVLTHKGVHVHDFIKFRDYYYLWSKKDTLTAPDIYQVSDNKYYHNMAFLEDVGKSGFMLGQLPNIKVTGNGADIYLIDKVDETSSYSYGIKTLSEGTKEVFEVINGLDPTPTGKTVNLTLDLNVSNGSNPLNLYKYFYKSKITTIPQMFKSTPLIDYTEDEIKDFTLSSDLSRSELPLTVALKSSKLGDIRLDNYQTNISIYGVSNEFGSIILPPDQTIAKANLVYEPDSDKMDYLVYNGSNEFKYAVSSRFANPLQFSRWDFKLNKPRIFKFHADITTTDGLVRKSNTAVIEQDSIHCGMLCNDLVFVGPDTYEIVLDNSNAVTLKLFLGDINFDKLTSMSNLITKDKFNECTVRWVNSSEFVPDEVEVTYNVSDWTSSAKNTDIRINENIDTNVDRTFIFEVKCVKTGDILTINVVQPHKGLQLHAHFGKTGKPIDTMYFRSDGLLLNKLYEVDENNDLLYSDTKSDSIFIHTNVDVLNSDTFSIDCVGGAEFDSIDPVGSSEIYGEDYTVYEITGFRRKFLSTSLLLNNENFIFFTYNSEDGDKVTARTSFCQGYCDISLYTDKVCADGLQSYVDITKDDSYHIFDIDSWTNIGDVDSPNKVVSAVASGNVDSCGRYPYFIPVCTRREYQWINNDTMTGFWLGDEVDFSNERGNGGTWDIDYEEFGSLNSGAVDILTVNGSPLGTIVSPSTYFDKSQFGLNFYDDSKIAKTYKNHSGLIECHYFMVTDDVQSASPIDLVYSIKIPIKLRYQCENELDRFYTYKFRAFYRKPKRATIQVVGIPSISNNSLETSFELALRNCDFTNNLYDYKSVGLVLSEEEDWDKVSKFSAEIYRSDSDSVYYSCHLVLKDSLNLGESLNLKIRSNRVDSWENNLEYFYTNDEIKTLQIKIVVSDSEAQVLSED